MIVTHILRVGASIRIEGQVAQRRGRCCRPAHIVAAHPAGVGGGRPVDRQRRVGDADHGGVRDRRTVAGQRDGGQVKVGGQGIDCDGGVDDCDLAGPVGYAYLHRLITALDEG